MHLRFREAVIVLALARVDRQALLDAMKGHVLASGEFVGTCSKP